MRPVGKTLLLRRERSGHRSASGTAGEHDFTAGRIGDASRIEARQRNDNGMRKALDRCLVRLAHVDEHEAAILNALSNLLRGQIAHLRFLLRHSHSPLWAATYALSPH